MAEASPVLRCASSSLRLLAEICVVITIIPSLSLSLSLVVCYRDILLWVTPLPLPQPLLLNTPIIVIACPVLLLI